MVASAAVRFPPRYPVAGVLVSGATYDNAVEGILEAARYEQPALVAATSVHGLTMAALDPGFSRYLNAFDEVLPDGQPVRWALNLLHDLQLSERVYGPTLMLRVCAAAAQESLSIYLYGSRTDVLDRLVDSLHTRFPSLSIAGFRSPPFRTLARDEDEADVREIRKSGARIIFVGLGCPRQEEWAYAHRAELNVPIVCVGAAFDFHAGTLRQAPAWMQASGLEWFFRLLMEPRRLWRRYAKHIPIYLFLLAREYTLQRVLHRSVVQPVRAREYV